MISPLLHIHQAADGPMTFWWIAMGIGSLLGLAMAIGGRIQTGRAVRRAVEQEGLLVRRIELRFLTRGPFSAEIGLPGIGKSDTLYRVLADDTAGRLQVLWARIPRGWGRPRCTVCRDVAPERTPRGINAPAFYALVACLTAGMIAFIIAISTGHAFGATVPGGHRAVAPTDTAFYGCSGGVTGGGIETGITGGGQLLVWDHQVAASHPEYQPMGMDSAAAVEIFRELDRIRLRAMNQGKPSNATCTVAIDGARGRHEVMFEAGSVPTRLQTIVKLFNGLHPRAWSESISRSPDAMSRGWVPMILPVEPGLTLVSALHFPDGDRENRVVLTQVSPLGVTYEWRFDQHSRSGTQQGEVSRFVSAHDFASAPRLNAVFLGQGQQETPGYTAITISRSTYSKVLALGQTPYAVTELEGGPGALSGLLPSRLVYRGNLMLTSRNTDSIPVLLDGRRTKLPSLHLHGVYALQEKVLKADYWVLSDSTHPLILKTVVGTDVFQMIRIDLPDPSAKRVTTQEQELERNCRLELPGVYFAFNSAELEAASGPAIVGVATLLSRHPDWALTIEGHTDSIGNAQANERLSVARADAVRAAIARQPGVAGARLSAVGFGASHPRESNATIEGRARNRRVELVRDCAGAR